MQPVVLSGGVGSRLWPLSRGMYPKQLLPLVNPDRTMLQETMERVYEQDGFEAPIVICNEEHRFIVAEQLRALGSGDPQIILEPEGRNTAPAIAVAAAHAMANGEDPLLLVMPADHVMADAARFVDTVKAATELAEQGRLVSFGIVPTSAETGYGYIKAGESLGAGYRIEQFKEKPDQQTADVYFESGQYYWNAGIFLFRASAYLAELKREHAGIVESVEASLRGAQQDLDFLRIDADAFKQCSSISVDYAVMEKTQQAAVVAMDVGWNDVGSWSALWEVSNKDDDGNVTMGEVEMVNVSGSHIVSESKLVAAVGVEDLVIVETADAVLVSRQSAAHDVKQVVKRLDRQGKELAKHHRKVYRPWGWYDSIDVGDRFQVKRINVKPRAKLSEQMHRHRAEHWVVVRGVAEVLVGENRFMLQENQSTYIPIGEKHSLHNPSDTDALEIIEVQSGSYLGEDDIVRFNDIYGRE